LRNKQALNVVIGQSPRYLIETVGVLIIISVAFYSLKDGYDKDILLATFATSAIALQRLLPYINQAYRSWVNISSNIYSFYDVMALINDENSFDESSNKINFYKSLAIKKMSFSYDDGAYILSDIDIDIKKGQKVGFIGVTGCGKSTLVDIIMGLLIPSEGGVYVDDVFISKENVRSWYSLISHVPQNIFILDDTLENNIAFGKNSAQINMELLIQSLKVACLEELLPYIESGKKMGEQGAILSGGQKQRIGIARSIYMQLPIIVFDEATSALDMVTEKRIMENISSLDSSPTILLIAHRLTTLKICDFILEIESGKIKKKMTYDSMV
jgi:ABC-type multidrug transport system fused ATPase/permease subunit